MRYPFPSWLASMLAIVLASGCAGTFPESAATANPGVTVVGVEHADTVRGINRSTAALDLARRLEYDGERRVATPARARDALGVEVHDALLARYALTGLIEERDLDILAAAPLGTRHALLARIERDEVRELEPRTEPVRDAGGRVLFDRLRIERATRRDMAMSVVLVDLGERRVRWRKRYTASPVSTGESVRYRGSSLSGSVAALLANRLVGGSGSPDAPPPAGRRVTLEAMYDEVAKSFPVR